MKIDQELKEELLTASPERLKAIRSSRPELSEVIGALLATEGAIAGWLAEGAGTEEQSLHQADPGTVPLPLPRTRIALLAAASVALTMVSAGLLWMASRPAPQGDVGLGGPAIVTQHNLNVETDSDYIVFPTSDPDVAVVWLMNGDE